MTAIHYHEIFTQHLWQEINGSRSLVLLEEDYWYMKRCVCVSNTSLVTDQATQLNCIATIYFDLYISVHVMLRNDCVIVLL